MTDVPGAQAIAGFAGSNLFFRIANRWVMPPQARPERKRSAPHFRGRRSSSASSPSEDSPARRPSVAQSAINKYIYGTDFLAGNGYNYVVFHISSYCFGRTGTAIVRFHGAPPVASPPPLWGRIKEGGRAILSRPDPSNATISTIRATPQPTRPRKSNYGSNYGDTITVTRPPLPFYSALRAMVSYDPHGQLRRAGPSHHVTQRGNRGGK